MINIFMTAEIIKIGIDQIVDIEEFTSVNKIEVDLDMNRIKRNDYKRGKF